MDQTGNHTSYHFETVYRRLRQTEGRLYTNEQVAVLPHISPTHALAQEWKIRKQSCDRLTRWLRAKSKSPDILEAGCGNGWLSAQLASCTSGTVTGTDIQVQELNQASEVFARISNLRFVQGDLRKGIVAGKKFHAVIFAASIQYFPVIHEIIDCALRHLLPGGEIHILDSIFYQPGEIEQARQRTREHFHSTGCPAMAPHYFHHCLADLEKYNYRILYDPRSLRNRIEGKKSPFYHLCFQNDCSFV